MWNEILGALTILSMILAGVVLIPASPKFVDAVCDRIRYGIQPPVNAEAKEQDRTFAAPASQAPTHHIATDTTSATSTATEPTTPRVAA